jgi:hypothetical protein
MTKWIKMAYPDKAGKPVRFSYEALPHEDGAGFSYNIKMGPEPDNIFHIDTKHGTCFSREELCSMHAFLSILRKRP